MPGVAVHTEFVVTTAEILDECVAGAELVIHVPDLRCCSAVTIEHDRIP
jgi:hypothetical protein